MKDESDDSDDSDNSDDQKLQDGTFCNRSRSATTEHRGFHPQSRAPRLEIDAHHFHLVNENGDTGASTVLIGCLRIHIIAKESVWTRSVLPIQKGTRHQATSWPSDLKGNLQGNRHLGW